MLADYLPVLVLLILATGLALLILAISVFFGPRKHAANSTKLKPYESGMNAIGQGQRRYPIRYYMFGVIFILFDVEVIFLYPFAIALRQLGWFGFLEALIFIAILFVGYFWLLRKGAFEWETVDKPL